MASHIKKYIKIGAFYAIINKFVLWNLKGTAIIIGNVMRLFLQSKFDRKIIFLMK